jgi:hypothetical protein
MKKLFLGYAWMLLATGAILTSVGGVYVFDLYHFKSQVVADTASQVAVTPTVATNAVSDVATGDVLGVGTVAELEDARPHIVANFLERHNSPMQPYDHYGQYLVDIADKYELDFRLMPAIAMQESNLCKKIPEGSYNCLGFGIHERGTLEFESYEANFDRAAREIKKNYVNQGRVTPEMIMKKYTPGSNGSWAESVKQWMAEMKYDDRKLGKELREEPANVLEYVQTTESASLTNY